MVRELRTRIVAAGIRPELFLLDRGSNSAGVVRYLQAARQPFIMPQAVHGTKPRNGPSRGLRAIREGHRTGWTRYSWKPGGGASGDRGPVRADFRVRDGVPYFLEINPLPGLNPESGDIVFLAYRLGLTYPQLVGSVLDAAVKRCGLG